MVCAEACPEASAEASADLPYDMNALLKEIRHVIGGGGGGQRHFAQGGGPDGRKVGQALEIAHERLLATGWQDE